MKKLIIILVSTGLLIFLVLRIMNKRLSALSGERQSYMSQLDLEFSGLIDSVTIEDDNHGLILFHVTSGNVDEVVEQKLNEQLEIDKRFVFLVEKSNNKFEVATHKPTMCLRGDSIYINTDKDLIIIYRQGKEISNEDTLSALRGSRW